MIVRHGDDELDEERARIDVDAVHAFLTQQYWALGRAHDVVADTVATAARVVGAYAADGGQIGFARVISDRHTTCYLADVYVLPEHRGRGLGLALVRFTVDGDPVLSDLNWILHTRDAHGLYERLGFTRPGERTMVRRLG